MRLVEARQIIHEVHGKSHSWLKAWGEIEPLGYTVTNDGLVQKVAQ